MKQLSGLVKKVSSIMDKLAGVFIALVMVLIVTNIILRKLFNSPILGTYEIVGFLTALGVGFALAHCAFQNAHIAIDFIMERLPSRIQALTAVLVNAASVVFWTATVFFLGEYAQAMKIKGLVSPSAEIPVYPFIYLVAVGLAGLCLVLFFKFLVSFKEVWQRR